MFEGAKILQRVRQERPLIHHLTNFVTMHDCAVITANLGALPVMAQAEEEVEEMVASAHAAVINTGTLSPSRARAMRRMGKRARAQSIPVVFDPVGAGSTTYRTQEIMSILAATTPAVIKGNEAEISLLTGIHGAAISGVQAVGPGGDPLEAALRLRKLLGYNAVIAVTGAVDFISDGSCAAHVFNGHALLPRVVGSGCMAASVMASFTAVEENYFAAATAALATLGVAAELAAEALKGNFFGPALFKTYLLDALYLLTPEELGRRARVEISAL
ncbi:MAG: hydroxyethylthiazole kinase [Dethiobacteria bacterium]|jgi:hydroxyethylthiazole kinase